MAEACRQRAAVAVARLTEPAGAETDVREVFHREAISGIETQRTCEGALRAARIAGDCIDPVLDRGPHLHAIRWIDRTRACRVDRGSRHVPEGSQPLRRIAGCRGPARRDSVGRRRQRALQATRERRVIVDLVLPLGGIGLEIVELGPRRADELPSPRPHGTQRTPSEQNVLVVRLGVCRAIRIAGRTLKERQQAPPIDRTQRGASQRPDRRGEIGCLDRHVDDSRTGAIRKLD